MFDWDKIATSDFWRSFRIPACGFALLIILLLFRNATESREFTFIRQVASYTLGACIIAYGHLLFHSTWTNRRREADLPFWAQFLAMIFHFAWFGVFLMSVAFL